MQDPDTTEVQSIHPPVYNRQLMAGLWQPTGNELQVRVHYLDTWSERAVMILVGTQDFRVRYAEAVSHRVAGGKAAGRKEVPEIYGLTAYLGAGREFRRALSGWDEADQWVELFLEGVKALVQAEYCVAGERGYSSEEEYERYFADKFSGSCIYYHQPPDRVQPWGAYVADQVREGCLFMRLRTTSLRVAGNCLISAVMMDSFHEMALYLGLEPTGSVARAEASIIRVPDNVCRLAGASVNKLVGLNLETLDRRDLADLLAGQGGCTHLADLVADAASLIRSARARAGECYNTSGRGSGAA